MEKISIEDFLSNKRKTFRFSKGYSKTKLNKEIQQIEKDFYSRYPENKKPAH